MVNKLTIEKFDETLLGQLIQPPASSGKKCGRRPYVLACGSTRGNHAMVSRVAASGQNIETAIEHH